MEEHLKLEEISYFYNLNTLKGINTFLTKINPNIHYTNMYIINDISRISPQTWSLRNLSILLFE